MHNPEFHDEAIVKCRNNYFYLGLKKAVSTQVRRDFNLENIGCCLTERRMCTVRFLTQDTLRVI